jgi:hypothetical protein
MISAKAVLFGDPHTGKSLLLDRLLRSSPAYGIHAKNSESLANHFFHYFYGLGDPYMGSGPIDVSIPRNGLFSILEFPPEELEYASSR